jgi:glycosyltransferase involved in cell wall biosynthesis
LRVNPAGKYFGGCFSNSFVLKIAVNTRLLIPGKLEGIGWFTSQTFKQVVLKHPEVEFTFFFDRPFSDEFVFAGNVNPVVLHPQARHPILYYLFFEQSIPRYLSKNPHDLFVSPDGLLSLNYPGRQIPVFHDLNFMHHPGNLPILSSWYYTRMFPKYARKATRIATVSEYSRQDIVQTFGYQPDKIDVVYNGVNEIFRPVDAGVAQEVRNRYTQSAPYFIYVGALNKRKNIENMLRAFDAFKHSTQNPHKLLIVGQPMFGSGSLRKAYSEMKHKADVVFVGRLYEEELKDAVAAAQALVLVSHFEGFGIPIIEAMKCDVPVITSNQTSMPEVAGDAALLVEPASIDSIAHAMQRIAAEPGLRNQMIQKGRVACSRFSWEKTGEKMWECIHKSLE